MVFKCSCNNWLEVVVDHNDKTYICPICNALWTYKSATTEITHCWGLKCNSCDVIRLGVEDGDYSHYCGNCGLSLRQHPFFGEEMEYDKGNIETWSNWNALSKKQKFAVYKRYGFSGLRY